MWNLCELCGRCCLYQQLPRRIGIQCWDRPMWLAWWGPRLWLIQIFEIPMPRCTKWSWFRTPTLLWPTRLSKILRLCWRDQTKSFELWIGNCFQPWDWSLRWTTECAKLCQLLPERNLGRLPKIESLRQYPLTQTNRKEGVPAFIFLNLWLSTYL